MDFHTYCLRKQTIRTYIAFLRMEDEEIRHHRFYERIAHLAIRVWPPYISFFVVSFSFISNPLQISNPHIWDEG